MEDMAVGSGLDVEADMSCPTDVRSFVHLSKAISPAYTQQTGLNQSGLAACLHIALDPHQDIHSL